MRSSALGRVLVGPFYGGKGSLQREAQTIRSRPVDVHGADLPDWPRYVPGGTSPRTFAAEGSRARSCRSPRLSDSARSGRLNAFAAWRCRSMCADAARYFGVSVPTYHNPITIGALTYGGLARVLASVFTIIAIVRLNSRFDNVKELTHVVGLRRRRSVRVFATPLWLLQVSRSNTVSAKAEEATPPKPIERRSSRLSKEPTLSGPLSEALEASAPDNIAVITDLVALGVVRRDSRSGAQQTWLHREAPRLCRSGTHRLTCTGVCPPPTVPS